MALTGSSRTAALRGQLRVQSDDVDGTVLSAIIPVIVSNGVGEPLEPADVRKVARQRGVESSESGTATGTGTATSEPAADETADMAPPMTQSAAEASTDEGFASVFSPEMQLGTPSSPETKATFASLKQQGKLDNLVDLVRVMCFASAYIPSYALCAL